METQRTFFGTDGIRGVANVYPMTAELAQQLGKAITHVLRNGKVRPKILIGKDTRLSGYLFESAIMSGIISMGGDVLLVGPMPTPAIAHLTKSFAADAGVVISASHNPADHNGIKIFSREGFKLDDSTELKIEKLFFSEQLKNDHVKGAALGRAKRIDDAKGRYIEFAKASVDNHPLTGLKVVLDCANGAAYDITPHILAELGAEVIALNTEPDGLNINKECGSLHPQVIKEAVLSCGADAGIALDGDADRVIMVDEKGNEVDGDHLMAIIALDLKKKGLLRKDTVVGTVMTNMAFDLFMKSQGIQVVRTKVGDPYIVEEMIKNGYNFGGEQSGHVILMDHTSSPDGTITCLNILRILKESGRKLSDMASLFESFPQVTLSEYVKSKRAFATMPRVTDAIRQTEESLAGKGRVLVRYSGTENKVRVMVEGPDREQTQRQAEHLLKIIQEETGQP